MVMFCISSVKCLFPTVPTLMIALVIVLLCLTVVGIPIAIALVVYSRGKTEKGWIVTITRFVARYLSKPRKASCEYSVVRTLSKEPIYIVRAAPIRFSTVSIITGDIQHLTFCSFS